MPSSDTITTWNVFSPDTLARSAQVNSNFDVFRGHLLPVNPNATGAIDNTYDLGSSNYKWRKLYVGELIVGDIDEQSFPSWEKITIDYTDLQAATTTTDIELLSLPAKGVIHGFQIANLTQFTGGSITNYQISVGITGALEKYVSLVSLATTTVNQAFSTLEMENFNTLTSIRIQAVATGSNLDSATAGQIDIYVLRSVLP